MKVQTRSAAAWLALAAFATFAWAGAASARTIYGAMERVKVVDATPIEVVARLDVGAPEALLNAVEIKYFQRDTATWVRFTIDNGSVLPGKRITLERPVLKDNHVRQRDGSIAHEPEIQLELCVGVEDFTTDVRLVTRSGYTPPMRLGQPQLQKLGAVDAKRRFTQDPRCVPAQPAVENLPPKI